MQPQLLYIDANTGIPRAQTTGSAPPSLHALLGCTLVLKAGFHVDGTCGPITDYTAASLRLVVKPADDPDAEESLFPEGEWAASGSGATVRYTWTGLANSAQLEALIGTATQITLRAQIEWMISTDTNPRKSLPFDLIVINSPARLDDGAPDVAGLAAKLWLIEQLNEGGNITFDVDSVTKVITINADLSAAAGAMTFKDVIDASANPNYPAATGGDTYAISVAGKIGGASGITVEIGDVIVCKTTASAGNHATVGTSWTILQSNITGITSDGLALMQAASVAIQRGLLELSKDVSGGVNSYRRELQFYATRGTDNALNNIANANGDYIECTDSGQTFSAGVLGTAPAGTVVHVRFTAVNTLTHNASTFILPTGANITTAAGDFATFRSRASGSSSWICSAYIRADGRALVSPVIASQAEAEAGADTTKMMTAERVAQAIAELAPGGGGGSALVRGTGVLQGYTSAPVDATPPPPLVITFYSSGLSHSAGSIIITRNSVPLEVFFGDSDPSTTPWIDTTSFTTGNELALALQSAVETGFGGGVSVTVSTDEVTINHTSTGVGSTLAKATSYANVISESGGGSGTDAVAGTGHVTEVTLIAQDGTKKILPVRLFAYDATGIAVAVQFALKVGGNYYPLASDVSSGEVYAEPLIGSHYAEWYGSGRASSALIARYTGTTPSGGSLRCVAIAEQY